MITRVAPAPTTTRTASTKPQNPKETAKADPLLDELKTELASLGPKPAARADRSHEAGRTERVGRKAMAETAKTPAEEQPIADRVSIGATSPEAAVASGHDSRGVNGVPESTSDRAAQPTDSGDSSGTIRIALESRGAVLDADNPLPEELPNPTERMEDPERSVEHFSSEAGRTDAPAAREAESRETPSAQRRDLSVATSELPEHEGERVRIEVSQTDHESGAPVDAPPVREPGESQSTDQAPSESAQTGDPARPPVSGNLGDRELGADRIENSVHTSDSPRETEGVERSARNERSPHGDRPQTHPQGRAEQTGTSTTRDRVRSRDVAQTSEQRLSELRSMEKSEDANRSERSTTARKEDRIPADGLKERAPATPAEEVASRRLGESRSVNREVPLEGRNQRERSENSGNRENSERRDHSGSNRERTHGTRIQRDSVRNAVREIEVDNGGSSGVVRRRVSSDAAGAVREAFRSAERASDARETSVETRTRATEGDVRLYGLRDDSAMARARHSELPAAEASAPVYATPRDSQPPVPSMARSVTLDVGEEDSGVKIRVEERNGDVSVRFSPSTDELQKTLESGVSELLQSLERQDVSVSDLTFSDGDATSQDTSGGHAKDQSHSHERRRSTEKFEMPDSISVSDASRMPSMEIQTDPRDRKVAAGKSR